MRKILSKVHFNKKYIFGLLMFMLLSSVAEMLLPTMLAMMIDTGVSSESHSFILGIALIMAILAVVSCVASILSTRLSARVSTGMASDIRKAVFYQILNFSSIEMDQFGTASLVARSTSDVTNVQMFFGLVLRIGVMGPMMAVAGLVLSAVTGG